MKTRYDLNTSDLDPFNPHEPVRLYLCDPGLVDCSADGVGSLEGTRVVFARRRVLIKQHGWPPTVVLLAE